jgi:sugar/nucleoside kinase (ribokinase family)
VLVGLEPESSFDEVRIELAKRSLDAVVTLDADGVFARFGDEQFLVPTRKIEAVDATGAGDNFLAAFLVARVKGLPIHKALAVGNVVAGEVVQYHGARLPITLDVPGLLQEAIQFAESLDN